ncbi:MAG: hypothetical protein M3Y82_14680 [Verrucomicrobiota bacterium]|nr:hypothetical protein [Verrucomicrobiota bacterium]
MKNKSSRFNGFHFCFDKPLKRLNLSSSFGHRAKATVLMGMLAILTGCSTFNHEWKAAAKNPNSESDIQGRWDGTWTSQPSGHNDKLRCIITKISEEKYRAQFHAKYKKVLGFGYTALFHGVKTNEVFQFKGEANLGRLAGGIYRYEGKISPTNFFSTYDSKYDRGIFQLSRPEK